MNSAIINEIEQLSRQRAYMIEIYSFSNGKFDSENDMSTIKFPAFIVGFTDAYKSEWNKEQVYGRMDPISTFKNTTRTISLSFKIPNDSINMAVHNMEQIRYLIRGLYPVYDEATNGTAIIISPPMFRIRFANLIRNSVTDFDSETLRSGLLCYMQGFDFKPDVESGFFSNEKDELYPKLINVDLSLEVIHEHSLGNIRNGATTQPRINFEKFPYGALEQPRTREAPQIPSTATTPKDSNQAKAAEAAVTNSGQGGNRAGNQNRNQRKKKAAPPNTLGSPANPGNVVYVPKTDPRGATVAVAAPPPPKDCPPYTSC